jgi:putative ABC transport system permease protein
MNWLRETSAICGWNFRNTLERIQPSLVAVVGFFGVVLVFIAMLSIRQGFQQVLEHTGSDAVAIVDYNGPGHLDEQSVTVIGNAPGVARGPSGPIAMGDNVVQARLPKRGAGRSLSAVAMRGVGPKAGAIWPHWHIVKGRMFKPGLDEIVVGRGAERLFGGLALGDTFNWNRRQWKVVGIFADGGSLHESEIWTDVTDLQSAYNAGNQYSGVYTRLTSAAAFPRFKQALEHNPQLTVSVVRESTAFKQSSKGLSTLITVGGGVVTLLMAIGAIFGAVNILYANVATRIGEIATLRAIGFVRTSVVGAILAEGIALGLIGGGAGALAAYLAFNGYQASTLANGSVTMAFSFAVTPALIGMGLGIAILMGLIGGLFPAIRAARLPVSKALREI